MNYTLNCVSWNSLKDIFHSVSLPLEISQNPQVFSCEFCEIYKNTYYYRTLPVAASECSRNLKLEKRTDQNFITKSPSRKAILHFEEKETVKAMPKGGYI